MFFILRTVESVRLPLWGISDYRDVGLFRFQIIEMSDFRGISDFEMQLYRRDAQSFQEIREEISVNLFINLRVTL